MGSHDSRRSIRSPLTFDLSKKHRARNVVTRSGGIIRGKFPSRKNGAQVQHEGLLELDSFFLFEAMPIVVSYQEQPARAYYPGPNGLRRYTPDVALELDTGEVIVIETKPVAALKDAELQDKLLKLEHFFSGEGYRFQVLLDTEIRRQPRLNNLKWIYHHASMRRTSAQQKRAAHALLHPVLPATIREASLCLQSSGLNVFDLMLEGELTYPVGEEISFDSMIDFTNGALPAWCHPIISTAVDYRNAYCSGD